MLCLDNGYRRMEGRLGPDCVLVLRALRSIGFESVQ